MDDEDRPRSSSSDPNLGAASLLSGESLERYSLDELDARVTLLREEIERVSAHRRKSADHMQAAEALFSAPSGRRT
ncbi:MAG TPA: DUF1192 domain-containing protein [Novosphingobium sp.]|nr:DUF1192 domain-containing protein [Novosphingobium sp.]